MHLKHSLFCCSLLVVVLLPCSGQAEGFFTINTNRSGLNIRLNPKGLFKKQWEAPSEPETPSPTLENEKRFQMPPRPAPVSRFSPDQVRFTLDPRWSEWKTNNLELNELSIKAAARGNFLEGEQLALKCAYGLVFLNKERRDEGKQVELEELKRQRASLQRQKEQQEKFDNPKVAQQLGLALQKQELEIAQLEARLSPLSTVEVAKELHSTIQQMIFNGAPDVRFYRHVLEMLLIGSGRLVELPSILEVGLEKWRIQLAERAGKEGVPKAEIEKALALNARIKEMEARLRANDITAAQAVAARIWKDILE